MDDFAPKGLGKAGRLTYCRQDRPGLLGKAGRLTKNLNFTRVRRLEMSKLQVPGF